MNNFNTTTHPNTPIPSWLETPPLSQIKPPVQTRLQELPFGELSWEDFERLCLRLVRLEANVEHCQLYGKRGQKQEGLDIYARLQFTKEYSVYQCKRVSDFGPAKIKDAVSKFLTGEWGSKANRFVLCTKESLRSKKRADELEAQSATARDTGIKLISWDSHQLSMKLKDFPKLVDDFFGRPWVAEFCGREEAESLGKRLDVKKVAEFRKKYATFYRHLFETHDPGLPLATIGQVNLLPLEDRYVLPDIYERRPIAIPYSEKNTESEFSEAELQTKRFGDTTFERSRRSARLQRPPLTYRQRQAVDKWLAAASRSIILGGPGSGKSTLLRFVAIDILQESPRLSLLSHKWGQFLPVWVPFALWTKMISDEATVLCSLSDLLHSWIKSWDEEQLLPLVEQALEDERLLLLVDGLDEWTNESAARIALDRLKVFIEQRDVPAIVTSRPHSFDRLAMQETGWQLGELSDFSTPQQKQLCRIWFTFRIKNLTQDLARGKNEAERKAKAETEGFFAELDKSADFRELAKVPLLLCLLIYHRFHNVRLPQGRFKAYDSLIEHLISVHPQRRRTAAQLTDVSSELTDDDVKIILAQLAYHIQEHFGEGLIDHNDGIAVMENYLKDCDRGFGLEKSEARQYSRELLEVGENVIGLLVRRSAKGIGFFHRVFQEYLSGYYLSRMRLDEQLSVVETHCPDSQWREVILGLFHITSRPEDIKQFVDRIKMKLDVNGPVNCHAIDLLLSEVAFGDFNCSVGLSREIAREAFKQVELGLWMPHRERVLNHVLDGLRSTKVRELVKSKLRHWFPCRETWRSSIFNSMTNWPRVPEVVECLWKGIHDEEPRNQRAAARALTDLARGDREIGDRISSLAGSAVAPKNRAAAIEALLRSWPNHEDIERILQLARSAISPELRLVAILGRIQRRVQVEEDHEELIRLGSWEAGVDYHWRDDVAQALMNGWPKSTKSKEACFNTLQDWGQDWRRLEKELALRILLESYPQDEDVAQFCVDEIRHREHPFILLHFDAWKLLSQNFKDHPQLVAAVDDWIPKQKHREPEIAMAAMVGRTPVARAKLLSLLSSSFPHWPARALLEGWGMEDTEVADRLLHIASGPAAEASKIGHLLPQIVEDNAACRCRLLELLRDPECKRPDFVMHGLASMGNTQGDTEVVDTVLKSLPNRETRRYWDVATCLIAGYSSDKRVKELAKEELAKRNGPYAAVALAYGDDAKIRDRIIEIACPLPVRLREVIATRLGDMGGDEALAMSLLGLYDHEQDEGVKTQASISYHTRLKASEQDTSPAVKSLSRSIVCYGPDYEERRRAAFCGLVILGRLDIMINAKEQIGEDRLCAISITGVLSPNVPLLRLIARNWDDIKAAFGDEFWPRLSKSYSNQLEYWDALCMVADQYPSPRNEGLLFLEDRPERTATPNMLRFLSRVRPQSQLLLEYCLKTLRIGEDQPDASSEEAVVAAEVLGSHFGGRSDVLADIMSGRAKRHVYEKVILALCEGWPEGEELEHIFSTVAKKRPQMTLVPYFQLICRKSPSKIVFDALINELSKSENSRLWPLQEAILRPLLRRLRTDDELFAMLTECLQNNPTPSEKATIPKLIGISRGLPPELVDWCIEKANRQLSGQDPPEIGVDLNTGEIRTVANALLDVLIQPSAVES